MWFLIGRTESVAYKTNLSAKTIYIILAIISKIDSCETSFYFQTKFSRLKQHNLQRFGNKFVGPTLISCYHKVTIDMLNSIFCEINV